VGWLGVSRRGDSSESGMDVLLPDILEGASRYNERSVERPPESGRWNLVWDESILEEQVKKRYEVTPKLCGRVTFADLDGL
jgi:hypothetical protein